MSNGDVAYSNRFFHLCVPLLQVSPPVPDHDCIVINCIGQGSAKQPIKIYNSSSDEVASTALIDPSLRHASPAPGNRIPTTLPFLNNPTALPGLIPTQPDANNNPPTDAAPVANIPVPEINKPEIPPAYNTVPVPCPFPAPVILSKTWCLVPPFRLHSEEHSPLLQPVFPTPRQLPVIPSVSELVLHSYIRYATGQPQVKDKHLRAFRLPLPIYVSDISERREPPNVQDNSQDPASVIFEESVIEARLYVKKA
ncbi:hypothetical protein PCANC_18648 [Puccinia coronata f. sp. avenae]|uniref:Uncharacterized protein n=1 Tax=Puccinia coronata f. sp. avenae TaxID=200324 RepID=A0A2N5U3Z4_9BASI|nr:hypothetical protein PCANC_18648 [Puccinia coronata f. sp. avenae]